MGRPDDDTDRIAFSYRPARTLWERWKLTVPRDTALHDRLDALLDLDADHDLDALVERAENDWRTREVDHLVDAIHRADPPEEAVRLTAVRIRRRCMTALPNAREHGADAAAEELAEIQALANDLLEAEE